MSRLSTAQIGKSGELLVQYLLLKHGVDSAPMTTDNGIDLVAYSARYTKPATIQVKTNLAAKRGGGKGKLALDWWLRSNSPAELVALVNLELDEVWLFSHQELVDSAQQKPEGKLHFYFYVDANYRPRNKELKSLKSDFTEFLLENKIDKLL